MQYVVEDGVYDCLSESRKSYIPELGGVLLAWDISKIKLKSQGCPPFKPEVIIKGAFTIFKPNPGERLWGRVIEVRPDLIICKTNEVLMVKVDINQETVEPGDSITYTFNRYHRDGKVGIIYGTDPRVEISSSGSGTLNDSTIAENQSSNQGTPAPAYRKSGKSANTPNRASAVTLNYATPNLATPNLTPKPATSEKTKTPTKPATPSKSTLKPEASTKKTPDSTKRKAETESASSKKLKNDV